MADEKRYVLVLDKERDFIRVFRADCDMRPDGIVLWDGNGLTTAYEAMIRLNKERRPIELHHVCVLDGKLRVFRGQPKADWKSVSTHTSRADALEALRARQAAVVAGNAARSRKLAARLRLAGVPEERLGVDERTGNLVSKVTEKDMQYLRWFEVKKTSGQQEFVVEAA